MTFSEQTLYALTKPEKYKEIIKLKTGRFVLFAIVISLILGIITFVIPTAAEISKFGGLENFFDKRMGEVSCSDGKLYVAHDVDLTLESTYILFGDTTHILIDTDYSIIPDQLLDKEGFYWAIGKEYVRTAYVFNHGIYNDTVYYMNLPDGLNNQMLKDAIPGIYIGFFIMLVVLSLGYFIKYAFFALILSLMVNSINKQLNFGLSNGQVFQTCFYGESLGMLISNFNTAAGFLDPLIVSIITIFISMHFITKAVVFLNPRNQI